MSIESKFRSLVAALPALAMFAGNGCVGDAKPIQAASAQETKVDSAGGIVVAPTTPYVAGRGGPTDLVINVGHDSTATSAPASGTCEVPPDATPAVTNAVVWVDGIRAGKPLPRDRRYELVSSGCALSPRIQGVVIGGAIDVYNDDRVLHTLIFTRAGTTDTLQTMTFTNDNEIVATDRLTKTAGIVEVRCLQHPQEKAYIAVFDHPYFGVSSAGQTLTMDSIPAGDYQVLTWREGMTTPASVATRVGSSGQTQVVVK